MNQNDRRSQICGMHFLPISEALVENMPGANYIKIRGEWMRISISSGELKEKEAYPGAIVEQELKAVITNTGEESIELIRQQIMKEGLLLLDMTNGSRKVVGSDQFPVLLSSECSGSPLAITISFKRESPEPAKIFKSF